MSIERGRVTRVVQGGTKVFVEVPKLGLGVEFGPCDLLWTAETADSGGELVHDHDASTTTTVAAASSGVDSPTGASNDPADVFMHTHTVGDSPHTHAATSATTVADADLTHRHPMMKIVVGAKVIVATIGSPDDVVVLGIIA